MSKGLTRAMLLQAILDFDYNYNFPESHYSIILAQEIKGKKVIPEIYFNPESSDRFIIANFNVLNNETKSDIAKIEIKFMVYQNATVKVLSGSIIGLSSVIQPFISKVYESYFKLVNDKKKLESTMKNLDKNLNKIVKSNRSK